jgi:hypothetical protein
MFVESLSRSVFEESEIILTRPRVEVATNDLMDVIPIVDKIAS